MRDFLFVLFLMLVCAMANGTENNFLVGDFSGVVVQGDLPESWQTLEFDGIDKHTVYTHVIDNKKGVIQAESVAGSSGLVRKIQLDARQFPVLSWQWKIQNIIDKADLTSKKGDDAPARVYITFAYNSQEVQWWEVVKFEAIKFFYGEYPPIAALTYVWASHAEQGVIMNSPYTSRVKIIVLQSGAEKKNQWLSEQRNIYEDYRRAFSSEDVPMISGVAIMTDTDNTGEDAIAWYRNILFSQ